MAKLFFSYAHEDENLRDQLEIHLSALKRQGVISTWHDRRITAGRHVGSTIDDNLEASQIILLLVSPDFIASDYCYERELQRALERHTRGTRNHCAHSHWCRAVLNLRNRDAQIRFVVLNQ